MSDITQKTFPYSGKWREITLENGEKKQVFVRSFWSLKSLLSFSGRAKRSYFWLSHLLSAGYSMVILLAIFLLQMISIYATGGYPADWVPTTTQTLIRNIFVFAGMISILLVYWMPVFSVSVRRLHDVNKSGWWTLLYLTPFGVFLFLYIGFAKWNDWENKYWPETQYY